MVSQPETATRARVEEAAEGQPTNVLVTEVSVCLGRSTLLADFESARADIEVQAVVRSMGDVDRLSEQAEQLLQRELENVAKITVHPTKTPDEQQSKPTSQTEIPKLEIDDLITQPFEIHRNHEIVARSKADSEFVELVQGYNGFHGGELKRKDGRYGPYYWIGDSQLLITTKKGNGQLIAKERNGGKCRFWGTVVPQT
jgi:hypothetical protein